MFGDGALTFREFAMSEPLPLATIHSHLLVYEPDEPLHAIQDGLNL